MKKIFPFFVLATLLSCSNDSTSDSEPTPEIPAAEALFIKEVQKDGSSFRTYTYDDQDRITTYTYHDPTGKPDFIYAYSYANDITTIVGTVDNEEYNRMEIFREDEFTIRENIVFEGEVTRYRLYHFSGSGCGHTLEELFDASGDLLSTKSLTYLDDNCSRMEEFDNVHSDVKFTMDGKISFDRNAQILPFSTSIGNVVGAEFYNNSGDLSINSYESNFEYNDQDYPVKEIRTYRSGDAEEYTYFYY